MDGTLDEKALTLEDILVFVTGADHVPPMGFGKKLTLSFDAENRFPVASTCSMTLYLPTQYADYDHFKSSMVEGLVSGFGFGQA